MALMLAKLYAALREAGVDDVKAREAAEEVASFENRLASVEASLTILNGWLDSTSGFNLTLTIAIVGMLFFVLANELAANAAATDTANVDRRGFDVEVIARCARPAGAEPSTQSGGEADAAMPSAPPPPAPWLAPLYAQLKRETSTLV
jgi:hypothetical protein